MPSIFVSHQAPGVLFKIAWPKRFDGTALCISAAAPDFELVFYRVAQLFTQPDAPWHWGGSHCLLGLLVFVLPLSLIGTILFCRWVGPWCAGLAKGSSKFALFFTYFGVDQWVLFRQKKFTLRWLGIASYSAIVGGITHLLLDVYTHKNMQLLFPFKSIAMPAWLKTEIADFGELSMGIIRYDFYLDYARLLWIVVSALTAVAALWGLRYIAKNGLLKKWYES